MIALVVIGVPLIASIVLAVVIGVASNRAANKAVESGRPLTTLFVKYLVGTGMVVLVLGGLLAVMFADAMDILDGDANPAEFMQYMQLQWIVLSLFPAPVLVISALLAGQKRRFDAK